MLNNPSIDPVTGVGATSDILDITIHSLADIYGGDAFDQGYARGTRDLLAIYPLLIEQFLHSRPDVSPATRRAVREMGRFVEEHIGRKLDDAGFVDGAGI